MSKRASKVKIQTVCSCKAEERKRQSDRGTFTNGLNFFSRIHLLGVAKPRGAHMRLLRSQLNRFKHTTSSRERYGAFTGQDFGTLCDTVSQEQERTFPG